MDAAKTLKYISLFSGIEAASVAWEPLGWEPIAFSEIEPFPCELLQQRFPNVPNLGDITKIDWSSYRGSVDIIVGGSPCQSFSIAGNRTGLKGESGLMFEYIRAVREVLPRYFVWENVPGALSSEKGAAFGQLLREMDVIGYGLAWRVLDAQFFGVPQRRRRVFLVGCLGNGGGAAQILFDGESMRWDYPSSRDKRKSLAEHVKSGLRRCYSMLVRCGCAGGGKGALVQDNVSATLSTSNTQTMFQPSEDCKSGCLNPWDNETSRIYHADSVAPTLKANEHGGFNSGAVCYAIQGDIARGAHLAQNGCGYTDDGTSYTLNTIDRHAVAYLPFNPTQVTSPRNGNNPQWGDPCHTLAATDRPPHVICMSDASAKAAIDDDMSGTLHVGGDPSFVAFQASNGDDCIGALCARDYKGVGSQYVDEGKVIAENREAEYIVRKLMPLECERLQGFPDGWTDIEIKGKPASDAARYKALGNSMAVPVMRWIGERIARYEIGLAIAREAGDCNADG